LRIELEVISFLSLRTHQTLRVKLKTIKNLISPILT
jgi:hypothetical protein